MNKPTRKTALLKRTGTANSNRTAECLWPDAGPAFAPKVQELETKCARLERDLEEVRRERQLQAELHAATVEQNTMLATLSVACQSLHNCAERKDVLLTVREIIANLVGCEEYILYRVESDGWLFLEDSYGLDTKGHELVLPYCGQIGLTAQTGQSYWVEAESILCSPRVEADLSACIPLKRRGVVAGVLALFRLLPQKSGWQQLDRELFRLLETHVAGMLYFKDETETQSFASGGAA